SGTGDSTRREFLRATAGVGMAMVAGVQASAGQSADVLQWEFGTGDRVRSSPTVVDDTVYVGSNDGNLYALNADDGEEEWRQNLGDAVASSPTVVDDRVFVGSDDGSIYARDASDAFDRVAQRCAEALEAPNAFWIGADGRAADWATHQIRTGDDPRRHLWGVRISMSWAAALRDDGEDVYLCAELPALRATGETDEVEMAMGMSIGQVIDRLGSALASTERAEVTVLLRLPLADSPHGIDEIIETMDVGDADAQIYVDDEGRLDPERSSSDAAVDEEAAAEQRRLRSALGRAKRAEDKASLLGESGLEEAERRALRLRDELRESLL
ncbi:MAG: PQQ-binding-like beta-propeller repeat protein, partial [Persicimonas sp.]